jgi:hypothetical protein
MDELKEALYGDGGTGGVGKNKAAELKKKLTRSDLLSISTAYHNIHEVLGRRTKIWPQHWPLWSERPKSVSQLVMKGVAITAGFTKKEYWLKVIRNQVSGKMKNMKANFKALLKTAYESEYGCY